uniref:Uncharacterized protein n=1 Tax=Cannabis sativa TaxID=3483 RepID=A0A803QNF4_CANSA
MQEVMVSLAKSHGNNRFTHTPKAIQEGLRGSLEESSPETSKPRPRRSPIGTRQKTMGKIPLQSTGEKKKVGSFCMNGLRIITLSQPISNEGRFTRGGECLQGTNPGCTLGGQSLNQESRLPETNGRCTTRNGKAKSCLCAKDEWDMAACMNFIDLNKALRKSFPPGLPDGTKNLFGLRIKAGSQDSRHWFVAIKTPIVTLGIKVEVKMLATLPRLDLVNSRPPLRIRALNHHGHSRIPGIVTHPSPSARPSPSMPLGGSTLKWPLLLWVPDSSLFVPPSPGESSWPPPCPNLEHET